MMERYCLKDIFLHDYGGLFYIQGWIYLWQRFTVSNAFLYIFIITCVDYCTLSVILLVS